MSVILNEPNLHFLLDTQEGAVGIMLERRAIEATDRARTRAQNILIRADVDQIVQHELHIGPLRAEIGVFDSGKYADYLATKADHPKEGTDSWLKSRSVLTGE